MGGGEVIKANTHAPNCSTLYHLMTVARHEGRDNIATLVL